MCHRSSSSMRRSGCAARSSPRPRCPTSAWASSRRMSPWGPCCRTAPPLSSHGRGCSSSLQRSSSCCSPPSRSSGMRCAMPSTRPAAPRRSERLTVRPHGRPPEHHHIASPVHQRRQARSPLLGATSSSKEIHMTLSTHRRRVLQGTALLGGARARAPCGPKASEEQADEAAEENKKKADEASELPSTASTRAEYDDVEDGGTLRLAVAQLPNNWNGSHADGALVDRSTIVDPMSASGIRFTEEGEWELDPDYIVSAEVTSEDPQIVTVQYNPDAVWETGDPITKIGRASWRA